MKQLTKSKLNLEYRYKDFKFQKEDIIILARAENKSRQLDYEITPYEAIGYIITDSGFKILACPLGSPNNLYHFTWHTDDIKDEIDILKVINSIPFSYFYR